MSKAKQEFTGVEGVYRWSQGFGRSGYLTGVFVAREDEVASVVGRTVYWGEALGKHSDVKGELEAGPSSFSGGSQARPTPDASTARRRPTPRA